MGRFEILRRLFILGCAALTLMPVALYAQPVIPAARPAPSAGKRTLLLFAKRPGTWTIITGGATGSMAYRQTTGEFRLKASGLRPRSAYALVRYADSPPAVDIVARGISDEHGQWETAGTWHDWTRKFWVVAGEDADGKVGKAGRLVNWRPERYLFEEKQLGVTCDCPEPEEP